MTKMRKNQPPPPRDQFPSHFFKRFMPETRPVVTKGCEHPGCTARGEYKAPARHYREERQAGPLNILAEGTAEMNRWFCLDHVKEYNAQWDYYQGLDEREMEAAIRYDTVWNRPSWPFGHWGPGSGRGKGKARKSSYDSNGQQQKPPEPPPMESAAKDALAILGLEPPVEFSEVKKRYRELVKQHHPDMLGGEENDTITRLNAAFTLLKNLYQRRKSG